jgi:predicted dehydrogenase
VVAVCDPDAGRRKEAEARFGCASYPDLTALLKNPEVELAVVATPSYLHAPNAIQALKAGKHVVVEKPMAVKLADADRMMKTSRATRKTLTVFHNRRYAPDLKKVKEIIDSGKLGKVVLIRMAWHGFGRRWDWQTLQKFGGGSLNNTGPHAIDQALQLFGKETPEIFCHMANCLSLGDAEDHVKIVLKGKKAPVLDIEITSSCAYSQDPWLVMGTRGGLHGNSSELHWKYFLPDKLSHKGLDSRPTQDRSYNADSITWEPEETWKMSQEESNYQLNFYRDVFETIRNRKPPAITMESSRRVVWVTEECYKQVQQERQKGGNK